MNVIKFVTLRLFWAKYPDAEKPLRQWYKLLRKNQFANYAELSEHLPFAMDYVAPNIIFDIGGNKYRLVAFVRFTAQTVFIKRVMTHDEYTIWNEAQRKRKSKRK